MSVFFLPVISIFGHKNILKKYCPWNRPWSTVEEMNEGLLESWNSTVKPSDIVYFLGDFALSFKYVEQYLPLLQGNIYWVLGNHDHAHPRFNKGEQTLKKMYNLNPNLKEIFLSRTLMDVKGVCKSKLLLHHFPWLGEKDEGHEGKHDQWKPQRKDYPKTFLLCGHIHSRPEERLRQNFLDIGWDAWGRLVNLEEIEEIINAY